MKFKVGDKVRVREDLVIGNCYGKERFVDGMKEYKGQIFTIKKNYGGVYIFEKNLFNWTDEMLEKVKKEKETQEKTFREVIADIKEGEVWVNEIAPINFIRLREDGVLDFNKNEGINLNVKYKLQRKGYTFEEAFKAYEEGKEIQSASTDKIYHKEKDFLFASYEISKKWYINN